MNPVDKFRNRRLGALLLLLEEHRMFWKKGKYLRLFLSTGQGYRPGSRGGLKIRDYLYGLLPTEGDICKWNTFL